MNLTAQQLLVNVCKAYNLLSMVHSPLVVKADAVCLLLKKGHVIEV